MAPTRKSKAPKARARSPAKGRPARKSATPPRARAAATGEAAVEAWLAAADPEQRPLLARIDALIREMIPGIEAHTKWRKPSNPAGTPFYGRPGQGWIVALWAFKEYVSVGFFAGEKLRPVPPESAVRVRRVSYRDAAEFDEAQLRSWLEQARDLPGWGAGSAEFTRDG